MRPVMIAMGSLILAGNLLLAVPLRQNAVTLRSAEQAERDVRKAVIEHLEARGLEPASAQELAAQHEERWGRKTLQGLTHFQLLFPEVKRHALVKELALQLLRRETFAFDDYDHLAGMLHRLKGVNLGASDYHRLRQCVLLNRSVAAA